MSSKAPRRVNWAILLAGLALVVPLVWLLYANFGKDPREVPFVLKDKPAPEFVLADLEGNRWALEDLRGKKVVINVWSTWCVSCKYEHPLLIRAPEYYPDVQFLGLLYGDDPVKARAYLKREGSGFPHLVDPEGVLALDLGVAGVPETFFIDEEGIIRYKHAGPLDARLLATFLEAR